MSTDSQNPNNKTILRIRKTLEKFYNNSRFQSGEITLITRYLAKITKIHNSTSPLELPAPKLYNMDDIIKMLGISKSTYFRLRNSGELKPTKVGGRDYCRQEDID
ncbi:helix-turn-helix transcriptional regulator [Sphingobacterium sp. NPDC055346]